MLLNISSHDAAHLPRNYSMDYKAMDGIFFNNAVSQHEYDAPFFVDSVSVANGHENDTFSLHKIAHLSIINAPLKVLIT